MKKSLIVLALAMVFVFAFAAVAFAYGPFTTGAFNTNYNGYLSWGYAVANEAGNGTSPHGNYTTSTNKCAVCHAVHKAATTGRVLTAWPGVTPPATDPNYAYQSCGWCHGSSSPLFASSQAGMVAGVLSPHGYCGRCHTKSVHGAGGSIYPVLKARMINSAGDASITGDLAAINTNVAIDMTTALTDQALGIGTGYLCGSCHTGAVAFPVTDDGFVPLQGAGVAGSRTGHRVVATNTNTWNEDNDYGVYFSGLTDGAGDSTVAFNAVTNCKSCHDARLASGAYAFPHSYVDAAGATALKTTLGSSYVWLTTAGDADDAHVVAGKTVTGSGDFVGTEDGLCLKCHLSGDRTAGVGVTF